MRAALLAALFFVAGALLLTLGTADADVPRKINYQAVLSDPDGKAVSGTVSLFVSLHDAETGGKTYFSENPVFDIVDGRIDVTLPLTFDEFPEEAWDQIVASPELWLEIVVDEVDGSATQYEFPRQSILTSGFAFRTGSIDDAVGGTIRGDLTVEGDFRLPDGIELVTSNGTLTITAGASSITMAPDGTLTISSSAVTVQSTGDIDLSAQGDVSIEGTNVDVVASSQARIEGAAGVDVSAGGTLVASASLVRIN